FVLAFLRRHDRDIRKVLLLRERRGQPRLEIALPDRGEILIPLDGRPDEREGQPDDECDDGPVPTLEVLNVHPNAPCFSKRYPWSRPAAQNEAATTIVMTPLRARSCPAG